MSGNRLSLDEPVEAVELVEAGEPVGEAVEVGEPVELAEPVEVGEPASGGLEPQAAARSATATLNSRTRGEDRMAVETLVDKFAFPSLENVPGDLRFEQFTKHAPREGMMEA